MPESVELSESECEALLRAGLVGRVAISTPDGPHIVPVNYAVVESRIILRTTPYSVLGSNARGAVLAFEVDGFDHERQRGWSVVARGRSEVISDAADLEVVRKVWEPRPWAAGTRSLYVAIGWTQISGRRLGDTWDPMSAMPARRNL
ncbi:pyridoxamine 5'-phosphate oxidase family protein [Nocardioides dokdonensis]|uniref:pyridoxamine 5'-phosphate oxidase family protein n=1 Tax=Nocardioides dokdonensis TaxID=450734 RepID=UPI00147253C7|nr:pyridoxamine 5'-phosphate oxidase family protein [Nocardioides dokdonensis]